MKWRMVSGFRKEWGGILSSDSQFCACSILSDVWRSGSDSRFLQLLMFSSLGFTETNACGSLVKVLSDKSKSPRGAASTTTWGSLCQLSSVNAKHKEKSTSSRCLRLEMLGEIRLNLLQPLISKRVRPEIFSIHQGTSSIEVFSRERTEMLFQISGKLAKKSPKG